MGRLYLFNGRIYMFERFFPSRWEDSTYDIDFENLYKRGYRNLIFDIDNTLVCHGAPQNEKSLPFLKGLMEIGFKIVFLSNNKEPRVKSFNDPLGAMYIYRAGKPNPKNYLKAVEMMGGTVNNTVFIGDQLFTDVWGANRAGISSILVKPIDKHEEIQIIIKRRFEFFVLAAYKRKLKKTATYGLIGNPVSHSKSPLIHNTFAALRGDNLCYNLYPLEENKVEGFLKKARKKGIKGFNVTVPYKEKVIPYLCAMSDTAKRIGAVNTLKLTKNGYFGMNTDVTGLRRTFKEQQMAVAKADCVILGAGGAAKGAAAALYMEGAKSVSILNRTYEKAIDLCDTLNKAFETDIFKAYPLSNFVELNDGLICIQASSLGLKGEQALILEEEFYNKLSVAMEIVPLDSTDFSERCKKAGVKCINGFEMLVNQAVDSYEFWNNCVLAPEDIEKVRGKVING